MLGSVLVVLGTVCVHGTAVAERWGSPPASPVTLRRIQETTPKRPVLCLSVAFTDRIISTLADGAWTVYATDVDGDGDVDALSASDWDDTVAWYENDGSQSFTKRNITTLADGAHSVFAIDVDGDGDVDVLSASDYDDTVAWYENDGSQSFTERIITTLADSAQSVFAIDVDGDGDVDALSASRDDDTVAWYDNDGAQSFTQRIVTTLVNRAAAVFAIDMDGDGDLDVVPDSVGAEMPTAIQTSDLRANIGLRGHLLRIFVLQHW